MNFRDLDYIFMVFTEKSITKAAKKLGISQPAVSRCLSNLEQELGTKLFEKVAGSYIPTAAGSLFIDFAMDIKQRKELFDREFQQLLQYRKGNIKMGITPARSKGLTPWVFPNFRMNFPDIKIEIVEDTVKKLEEGLRNGLLDVVYFTVDEQYANDNPEFYIETLGEEELVLAIKKGTILKNEPVRKYGFNFPWVELSQFTDKTFITLKSDMRIGQITDQILCENNIHPEIIRLSGMGTVLKLVEQGYGVCICGSLGIEKHRKSLDIYSIGKERIRWKFVAAYRIGSYITEPLQYLTELYKKASELEKI